MVDSALGGGGRTLRLRRRWWRARRPAETTVPVAIQERIGGCHPAVPCSRPRRRETLLEGASAGCESRLPAGKTWETFEHDRVPLFDRGNGPGYLAELSGLCLPAGAGSTRSRKLMWTTVGLPFRRTLRAPVPGHHLQPGLLPVGAHLRQPNGHRGRHRPGGPSLGHPGIQRPQLPAEWPSSGGRIRRCWTKRPFGVIWQPMMRDR